jgi:3-oxoacyl-[acyl-carrier-protein] synthase II
VRRRIVVTGLGVICSAGKDQASFTDNLLSGASCLSQITDQRLDPFGIRYAGLIGEIDKGDFESTVLQDCDRFVHLAAIAAREALEESGINQIGNKLKIGLLLGTCSGPMLTIENFYKQELAGKTEFSQDQFFKKQYYSAAHLLASYFWLTGPVMTVTTACSAFTAAVAAGSDLIKAGLLDAVLVGGADSFSATTFAGFAGLKALNQEKCAPFSRPAGLNLGEGSGFVVLEDRDAAKKRNAIIIGEILGSGLSNDAYHCSAPDPAGKGAALSMQRALQNAAVTIESISYVNAHGTGTDANDKAETKAIKRVFGDYCQSVPVSSMKAIVGHCLGAAGAVETVGTFLCAKKGVYPSTVNFSEPRDGCTLDYIPDTSRVWPQGSIFVKNNFAFGGNNASLVIGTDSDSYSPPNIELCTDPICITGIGVLSAAGVGLKSLHNAWNEKINFVKEMNSEKRYISKAAQVPNFELSSIDRKISARGVDRAGILASAAASLALSQAKISDRPSARAELGFYMNLAQGSTWAESEHIMPLLGNQFKLDQINAFPYIVPNSITGTVCRLLSLSGHNNTFCYGPGAGLSGLAMSWAALKNEHVPAILCGAIDELTENGLIDCYLSEVENSEAVSVGEGAAMMLLEKSSNAALRNVAPLAFVSNAVFSYNANAADSKSREKVLKDTIYEAVAGAGIKLEQLGSVCYNSWNKHEENAIKEVLGDNKCLFYDTSLSVGYSPASSSLFNIGVALSDRFVDENSNKKYIIAIISTHRGNNCVMVLEKPVPKE